jgi:hypothetical protein
LRDIDPVLPKPLRSIGIALAVAALCASVAGCISDGGTSLSSASQGPSNGVTMRYYGGPKYPMWPSPKGTDT